MPRTKAPMMNRTFKGASEIVDTRYACWYEPVPLDRAGEKREWLREVEEELNEEFEETL